MQKNQNSSPPPHKTKTPRGAKPKSNSAKKKPSKNWEVQYEELNRKYQFLMAEYANYKKNTLKQTEKIRKYEGQHIIQQLIEKIIDDFDRALKQDLKDPNPEDFKKGFEMIYNNLKNVLRSAGVTEEDSTGKPFDPEVHSALDSAPSEDIPPEHILHVVKKAYFLHDRLIRPAEVIVSRKLEPEIKNVGDQ